VWIDAKSPAYTNFKLQRPLLMACASMLVACATQRPGAAGGATYPLYPCKGITDRHCVAALFANDTVIATRDPSGFPRRYLEIGDSAVRTNYCQDNFPQGSADTECQQRLAAVADYFNPRGLPAGDDLAVALEGGGTKAAPFDLGVLAGLDELGLLQDRVKAIASISGGSYAASYYFNRLYDLHEKGRDVAKQHDDWFRSCVPDHFSSNFKTISVKGGQTGRDFPWCDESNAAATDRDNEFDPKYEFLGHVWKNHDLLRGDAEGNLSTQNDLRLAEYANIGLLAAETGATIPFQFVARTAFRWPMNSAPSKLAYKLGLEREYGYSPQDWKAAGNTEIAHFWDTLQTRRKDRTLSGLAALSDQNGTKPPLVPPPPMWIIGTTAPGKITGLQWAQAAARDPLRQQFEITPDGYGSGTYGYARQLPEAPFDFLGRNPTGLPILDAVVASAAFLDEDQTQVSAQPLRFFAGTGMHFANLTWFTEIPNFNVGDGNRVLERATPWPLYLIDTNRLGKSPYIHLQDGGNTENSGIFPLLRRGYKTIIYAHGTQDTRAEFASMCHLKNQLELDGSYILVSPDLERLVSPTGSRGGALKHSGSPGRFRTYLDALCSKEMDVSDLVAFDQNPKRKPAQRDPAVARLYCARLGYLPMGKAFVPCEEFGQKFGLADSVASPAPDDPHLRCNWYNHRIAEAAADKRSAPAPGDQGLVADLDLFYFWPSDTVLHFKVYRGDPLECNGGDEPASSDLVSTVVSIVPGVSFDEIKPQWDNRISSASSWNDFCRQPERASLQIKYCAGPSGNLWSSAQEGMAPNVLRTGQDAPGLSCTALAYVLEDGCAGSALNQHPNFPQDNFVGQTLHDTYTRYAAYFDLGRHLVRRAIFCEEHPQACASH